jgi:hypothetical protein
MPAVSRHRADGKLPGLGRPELPGDDDVEVGVQAMSQRRGHRHASARYSENQRIGLRILAEVAGKGRARVRPVAI